MQDNAFLRTGRYLLEAKRTCIRPQYTSQYRPKLSQRTFEAAAQQVHLCHLTAAINVLCRPFDRKVCCSRPSAGFQAALQRKHRTAGQILTRASGEKDVKFAIGKPEDHPGTEGQSTSSDSQVPVPLPVCVF